MIVEKIIRDPNTFTQGIKIYRKEFFESAGLYGESGLYRYRLSENSGKSGKKVSSMKRLDQFIFPDDIFAEDIEIIDEFIYLLTWKEKTLYVFDLDLKVVVNKDFLGEGWGIAYDGKHLITSDGSSELTYRNPESLVQVKKIGVTHRGKKLSRINALEYALGNIYANIWFDNRVYIISPNSGEVIGIVDCETLVRDNIKMSSTVKNHEKFTFSQLKENVLNGITYDPEEEVFYLTGKRWSYFYKVLLEKK